MRYLSCVMSIIALLSFSTISVAAEEVKTVQSKITKINQKEMHFSMKLDGEDITMKTDKNTEIVKDGKTITLSDIESRDKAEISYMKEDAVLGLGKTTYLAKKIKVLKVKTEGTGKVVFVEPETKSIAIEIGDTQHLFGITKDTTFKGVKSLADVNKNDQVFVDYKVDDQGAKILILLEKKGT